MFVCFRQSPGEQFNLFRGSPIDTGDVDVEGIPYFKHVFRVYNIADLDNDKRINTKVQSGSLQTVCNGALGQIDFAYGRNAVRVFRKPQRFFVVKAFFVRQPVAGFAVKQTQADAVGRNTDIVDNGVFDRNAADNFVAFLFDNVCARAARLALNRALFVVEVVFYAVFKVTILPFAAVIVFVTFAALFAVIIA